MKMNNIGASNGTAAFKRCKQAGVQKLLVGRAAAYYRVQTCESKNCIALHPPFSTASLFSAAWAALAAMPPKKYDFHTYLTIEVAVAAMGLALRPTAARLRMGLAVWDLLTACLPALVCISSERRAQAEMMYAVHPGLRLAF